MKDKKYQKGYKKKKFYPKKFYKKPVKQFVEIKTNRLGWTEVELISVNKGGTITIKLKDQLIKRKAKHIRAVKHPIEARPGVNREDIEFNEYTHRKRFKIKKGKSKPVNRLNNPFKPKLTSLDIFIKDVNKKSKKSNKVYKP